MITRHQGQPSKRRWGRHTVIMDSQLFGQVKARAQEDNATMRAVVERALKAYLTERVVHQNDAHLAPLVDRLIQDRHQRLEAGLRTMIARVAHEVLRTQFVWLNFVTEAGVPASKVDSWYDQGWHYAVREFRRQRRKDESLEAEKEVK